MKYFKLIALAGLLLMSSCYQDRDDSEEVIITPVPVPDTNTNISGNLIEPNSGSIEDDYTLVINDFEHRVESGLFLVNDVRVKKQGQLIEAYRDNQLVGLGFHHLIEFDLNKIQLVTVEETTQTMTQQSPDQWSSDLGPVNLVVQDINPSGMVIQTCLLDQATTQMAMGSTGFAFDANGESQLLSTVPQYGFTLRSEDLEQLSNLQYQLVFDKVESDQVLMRYNKTSQQWHQIAQLTQPTITVTELGYYMVAEAGNGIYQEGQAIADGMPVSFLRSRMNHLAAYEFYTTEQGRWGAVLPESQDIALDYLTPCDEQISSVDINAQVGLPAEIVSVLDNDEEFLFQVNAEVLDCSGELSTADGLQIDLDGTQQTLVFSDEGVDHQIAVCNSDFSVSTYSIENDELGPPLEWSLDHGDDLGVLIGCGEYVDGFAYLEIRDDIKIYEELQVSQENGKTKVSLEDETFWISFAGLTSAQYEENEINVILEDPAFGDEGYSIGCATSELGCGITDFEVTHYDNDGGWLRLTFSGEVFMRTIHTLESGYFPVSGIIQVQL